MMRKTLMLFLLLILIAFNGYAQQQNQPAPERPQRNPEDYAQLDPNPYDPAKEPDVDMFISNWRDSVPKTLYGSVIEHEILTPLNSDNPLKPIVKGAVLTEVKGFSYATLEAGMSSGETALKNEQHIYYVTDGSGSINTAGKTNSLYDGIALIIPPGVSFKIDNTGSKTLGMYLLKEPIPEGFAPRNDVLVRDANKVQITDTDGHWSHVASVIFGREDGLAVISGMAPVYYDPLTIGQPHSHGPAEEVWFAVKGDVNITIGKQMRKLPLGSAYKIPPNNLNPHSNINATTDPIKMVWFMTRGSTSPLFEKIDTERRPYTNLESSPYDPETDPNIDMFMQNWKESMPLNTHGNIVERDILKELKGDILHPEVRGAVLQSINRLVYASLYSNYETSPVTLKGEQELIYMVEGSGIVTAGGKTYDLYPGVTILIPENLEFTMKNTCKKSMRFYMVSEPAKPGFKPVREIVWCDEDKTSYYTRNAHWTENNKNLLDKSKGLSSINIFETVTLQPRTFSQPHSHKTEDEEIYIALKGDIIVLLGKQLRELPAGTAYYVPQNGLTPHANYNFSTTPVKLLHVGVRGK